MGHGHPQSLFHRPSLTAWLAAHDLPDIGSAQDKIKSVLHAALIAGQGDGDIFGLRLQGHSLPFFLSQLRFVFPEHRSDVSRIEEAFGETRFIHLTRQDKLAQAVSYIKAEQTGLWHRAPDGTEIERLSAPKPPVYDRDRIKAQIGVFERMDQTWEAWFQTEGIAPYRLTYDDLAQDSKAALIGLVADLGVSPTDLCDVDIPVARLSDAINLDWITRYLA